MNKQNYDYYENNYYEKEHRWNALDPDCEHSIQSCKSNDPTEEAVQEAEIDQSSNEVIIIRDSCDINVETTDTQIAASLQAALQVAIAVVINITIADSSRAETVTQELLQNSQQIGRAH